MFYIYILIINFIILCSAYVIYKRKLTQHKNRVESQTKENYINSNRQILEQEILRDSEKLLAVKNSIDQEIEARKIALSALNEQWSSLTEEIERTRARTVTYEQNLRDQAEKSVKGYEQTLRSIAEKKAKQYQEEKLQSAEQTYSETMADLSARTEAARARIEQLRQEIEAYGAKQQAINEAIIRQREIEEQQDFYRICVSEEAITDIDQLKEVRKNLKKPEIIDKIIYDNYIAKPVLEMVKRVLQNESFSGIYKITNLKTNEIYIGRSSDIRNRWQQHCKTVFNCGTIATSLLHIKMKKYGIENFTFEVVERAPKEKLPELEKFYIDFYKTKEYGMNERKGG